MVWLSDRVPSAIKGGIKRVFLDNPIEYIWRVLAHPFDECWAKIKAQLTEVTLLHIWLVAGRQNAFIPIGKWRRTRFFRDLPRERILARGLVKMGMDAERSIFRHAVLNLLIQIIDLVFKPGWNQTELTWN